MGGTTNRHPDIYFSAIYFLRGAVFNRRLNVCYLAFFSNLSPQTPPFFFFGAEDKYRFQVPFGLRQMDGSGKNMAVPIFA